MFNHHDTPYRFQSYFTLPSSSTSRLTESKIKSHLKHNAKLNWRSFDDLIDSQNDLFEIRVANDCKHDNWQSR